MNKMDQSIMVVPTETLLGQKYFEGFVASHEHDYQNIILENFKYLRRGNAEEDPSHKQPISYCLIVNPGMKKVFAYQRAVKDEHYTEQRLQGKWSWGIGGHIEELDEENGNPIHESMLRELEEEITINGEVNIKTLGYINYDNDDVSKVHFGILYLIETDATQVEPKDEEVARGEFLSLSELEEICSSPDCSVEAWSKIALQPLKEYLN